MFKKLFGFLLGSNGESESAKAQAPANVEAGDLQGFVEFVVKSLVDHPEEMEIIPEQNEGKWSFWISAKFWGQAEERDFGDQESL